MVNRSSDKKGTTFGLVVQNTELAGRCSLICPIGGIHEQRRLQSEDLKYENDIHYFSTVFFYSYRSKVGSLFESQDMSVSCNEFLGIVSFVLVDMVKMKNQL